MDFLDTNLKKGVLVVASLIDFNREAITIRVMNLNKKPMAIKKETEIATCEQVENIITFPSNLSDAYQLKSVLENLDE